MLQDILSSKEEINMDQYSEFYTDVYGNPTRMAKLPSIYILGYLDVQKGIFINNTSYAFGTYKRDKNIAKLRTILDKKYEEILKRNSSKSVSNREDLER